MSEAAIALSTTAIFSKCLRRLIEINERSAKTLQTVFA